jgi:DNA gyrase subunit B
VRAFVEYLNTNKTTINRVLHFRSEQNGIGVEVAMQWNDSYQENVFCYTNNIPQRDGGHPPGRVPRRADAHLNSYIEKEGLAKRRRRSPPPAMTRVRA